MSGQTVPLLVLIGVGAMMIALTVALAVHRRKAQRLSANMASHVDREAELQIEAGRLRDSISALQERFSSALVLENEVERLSADVEVRRNEVDELRAAYQEKKSIYDRLSSELAIFDERLAFGEMGVYEPHFDFTDSEQFKASIVEVRTYQKQLVSNKMAVVSTTNWTVNGSSSKGQTMTNRNIRLTLRAFNNECDAAIANIRWNNANAMEKRIIRAQEQIDKLNESNAIVITGEYAALKLRELRLTHEYKEKQKAERDERAEANRRDREEQRLMRDLEEAGEEENRYARLLEKARQEANSIVGPQLHAFAEQVAALERDLELAHARFERAQALAEKTRTGYVYIISNIGSFGEDVIKIGLTRRLDPMDRVRELGDASVPFKFDTHAIIYSEDAPALEGALHAEFDPDRINSRNYRKEFFRASLEDVEAAVRRLAPDATFLKDIEAQEYRETLARREQLLERLEKSTVEQSFPAAL